MPDQVLQKELRPDFYIRDVWHKISRLYNQKAAEHGLSMSVGFILFLIEDEGTPSTYLGPRMGMEPTSLSRTLKNMENSNLIVRKPDPKDKRMMRVFLTTEGKAKRDLARDVVGSLNNKLYEKINAKKMATFLEVMRDMDDIIKDELNTK